MKMDIEGSEVEALPDLLWSGAMSHIDTALIEFHARLSKDQFRISEHEDHEIYCSKYNYLLKTLSHLKFYYDVSLWSQKSL